MHLKRTSAIAVLSTILVLVFCLSKTAQARDLVNQQTAFSDYIRICQEKATAFKFQQTEDTFVTSVDLLVLNNSGATKTYFIALDTLGTTEPSGIHTEIASKEVLTSGDGQTISFRVLWPMLDSGSDRWFYIWSNEEDCVDETTTTSVYFSTTAGSNPVSYTTNFSDQADATWSTVTGKAKFALYKNDDTFTIDNPVNNTSYFEPVSLSYYGRCIYPDNIFIETQYSSSLVGSLSLNYASTTCAVAGTWLYNYGTSTAGYYALNASTTAGYTDGVSYVVTSITDTTGSGIGNLSCTVPTWSCPELTIFVGDVCKAAAKVWSSVQCKITLQGLNSYVSVINKKPFSYIPEIYNSIRNGVTASSTAGTLPEAFVHISTTTTSPFYHPNMTLFQASTLTSIIPQNQWDTVRPYIIALLYIIWLRWLWFRILRS